MSYRSVRFHSLHAVLEFIRLPRVLIFILGLTGGAGLTGQILRMDAAPKGVLESGAPPFAIFSSEVLGLNSPPTDLHLMPDGRLLLFASRQIALGDGVRWEVFRQAPEEKNLSTIGVAVDRDGQIFMGVPGGFSRVNFGDDGLWRLVLAAPWPATENPNRPVPRRALEVGQDWLWHSGSGSVISWRPGQPARIAGQTNLVEHIFSFQNQTFLSERTEAELFRLSGEKMERVEMGPAKSDNYAITCASPYNENSLLVGTFGRGVQLFDGREMRPLVKTGVLAGGLRINDLCETAGGFYAAAIESYGLVFFNRQGQITQVLDRSVDHRLSRVKQLLPVPGGLIWALLDDGVLRVEFPSRISNYEPIIGNGITSAYPYRFKGELWIWGDGKLSQGVYDASGRLTKLVDDYPADRHVYSFSTALPYLIAGTDQGGYYRGSDGWVLFAPESNNLRVLDPKPKNGRWLYGAKNEIGWLRADAQGVTMERIPTPELHNIFSACTAANGTVWFELGSGRLGRVRFEHDRPVIELFDHRQGVPDGWAQVFEIGGVIGFNVADQILRFDETTQRFLPDENFSKQYPGLTEIVGRPGLDAQGRLWITANGGVQVLEKRAGVWQNLHERMPPGLRPLYYTFESNGVVWLHAERRLVRFDPALPATPPVQLRALLTHVDLVASNRTLFAVDRELPPLKFSDNSLNAHFMAPGNPFTTPVTFEVMLEGADGQWVSTGGSGSAVFNRLKEGHYVLHVRPRSGDTLGNEVSLAFSIRPPWFRTPLAYFVYALSSIGVILFTVWLVTYLQRRENVRLESLVAQRTSELKDSNLLLATQVEEIRMLSQAIGQSPVAVIITKPDNTIVFANPQAAELTGYTTAELTGKKTDLLRSDLLPPAMLDDVRATFQRGESWHGQLANRRKDGSTVHVRATISPIRNPEGQVRLRLILAEDIGEWLADQERRQRLEAQLFQSQKLESVGTLAGGIAHDFNNILTGILGYCELARFNAGHDPELMSQLHEIRTAGLRAKDLVAQILTFSRRGTAELVPLDLVKPVGEALRLIRASTPTTIALSSELETGIVKADSTQIQQIVLNLCTNAVHAIGQKPGQIEVSLKRVEVDATLAAEVTDLKPGPCLRLTVKDNGHGMPQATLDRIFDPFFTTKRQGEGTGLGLSIVQGIMATHHGALRVRSKPDEGSTFDLYFPLCSDSAKPPAPTDPAPRGAKQEILVVDDEPSVGAFVTARLQQLGYRVVTFGDPREALAAYQAEPARFHALVTDLTMPHMTGMNLIDKIRSGGRIIPAVIITGYGRDAGGTQLVALPRCQILHKPFGGEDLARVLNQVMSDGLQTR